VQVHRGLIVGVGVTDATARGLTSWAEAIEIAPIVKKQSVKRRGEVFMGLDFSVNST